MKIELLLRNENDQEGNTWFSNALGHPEANVQVHMPRELYVSMGEPQLLTTILIPKSKGD